MKALGRRRSGAVMGLALAASAHADIAIDPYYAGSYTVTVVGSAPGVPANYGGLTIKLGDNGTLLLGGAANKPEAKIYSIGLERDAGGHIVGFTGDAMAFAAAYGGVVNRRQGGIDAGLAYGPGGVLFYTSYFDNHIGQIEPGSTEPDKRVDLNKLAVARSVGGLTFVPEGLPGAGRLKLVSNTLGDFWYDATVHSDGTGTYDIVRNAVPVPLPGTPAGIVYVRPGSRKFDQASVLVVDFVEGSVMAYEVNSNGDPVPGTGRTFLSGLSGALGAGIDPLTHDFLFSTFGGGNLIVRVSVVPEPGTWVLLAAGLALLGVTARRRLSAGARAAPGARVASPPAPAAATRSGTSPA